MKKVLIITYYWPPAGGPGVQRWLKFVKYLPEFGIEPIVYIPENPTYPIHDKSLLAEVPEGVKILKQPIFEPYRYATVFSKKDTQTLSSGLIAEEKKQSFVQKMLLYIRGNFFIPDARKYWVKPSIRFLDDYVCREKINTIITTGPPHSLHLIGLGLKKNSNLKWIADFRDPWTNIGYQEKLKLTKSSEKKHQEMENEVLKTADKIIVTSFTTQKEFQGKTEKPMVVITNGFDDYREMEIALDKKFTLSHIGSLLSGRNPLNLWKAFSELVSENDLFRENFRLRLIGKTSQEVLDSIYEVGLRDHVDLIGYVPHTKALEYQLKSQVLLLLEINDPKTRGIIPGKLFEYMRSKRPVLAVGPKEWDVCKIINETESGRCLMYSEKEKIKKTVWMYFDAYGKEELKVLAKNVEKYHRRKLTEQLAKNIKL